MLFRITITCMSIVALLQLSFAAGAQSFVHPGLLHKQADLNRIKARVNAKAEPWLSGWNRLIANSHAATSYTPRAVDSVFRGFDGTHHENYSLLFNDAAAAYATAIRWKISGDMAYADKSIEILNAWAATLKYIGGTSDRFLAAGLYGYQIANAAEIMRTYKGWKPNDLKRFQQMMMTVFYPMNHDFLVNHNHACISHYWANWDQCNMMSVLAIGVLCDNRTLYNEAIDYFKHGAGNGAIDKVVYYIHSDSLAQWQESGRDQGHALLGIGLMGIFCEMAWNQGDDLYGYDNNRFLKAAEYVAKYNLGNEVPYASYDNCDHVNQTVISAKGRGGARPIWELVYNHYVKRKTLLAPYITQYAQQVRPEGGGGDYGPNSGGFDQLGYGTLLFTLDAEAKLNENQELGYCVTQAAKTLRTIPADSSNIPRSIDSGKTNWRYVNYKDWTSGFWPGILWYAYEFTKDARWKTEADRFSKELIPLSRHSASDHDLGFQTYCSLGNGLRLTRNALYKKVLLATADTLATLFNPKVGTILSWPGMVKEKGWPHNTIIDNMMNLELLFWAAKNGGDKRLYDIAVQHATTTMQNHFRPDYSVYHVIIYDTLTGKKIKGITHQGYADESMWARGQSWAIYGFTMVYRETKQPQFLDFAQKVADVYLKNLPAGLIPYWDFNAPDIPNAPKDASAAAVTASALLELSTFVSDKAKAVDYRKKAEQMLVNLSSNKYQSRNINNAFLLHSTGHKPKSGEVDASIIYADYYYMEALLRSKKLKEGKSIYDNL